jgi:hypothetical protein
MSWYDVAKFYASDENGPVQKDFKTQGDGRDVPLPPATDFSRLRALVDLDCPYVRYDTVSAL